MLAWLSVWGEVRICVRPSWSHCHSLSLAWVKSRLVLVPAHWVIPHKVQRAIKQMCVCVCLTKRDSICWHCAALYTMCRRWHKVDGEWFVEHWCACKWLGATWTEPTGSSRGSGGRATQSAECSWRHRRSCPSSRLTWSKSDSVNVWFDYLLIAAFFTVFICCVLMLLCFEEPFLLHDTMLAQY